jgi:hypothetical protein
MKVAVQARAPISVTVPSVQSGFPLQPAKPESAAAVAVRVTVVYAGRVATHVGPQSIPTGVEVTVPLPVPTFVTARG